ncbi:DCC1-like thiol-disulfide oxidoreductase family protein [Halorussus caseinilyticus]|uniref:DCC1-like thiol-disulfide oxidoreductase family protein n=1 Tax=Halorussus caseinilyticus TaxID=3034025 RepID=A0ABD5WRN6_9EURY|nr:DCC1-like thiol-disulfide oxidoreductase family protein [Halorussus sp. DT72]
MDDATLVFDDDCGFCTWWADFFANRSNFRVVGFTELTDEERGRLPDDYEECAHLLTDDEVYSCGESLEQAFVRSAVGEDFRPVVRFLRNFEDYEHLREALYREIADRRGDLGVVVSKTPPAREQSDENE